MIEEISVWVREMWKGHEKNYHYHLTTFSHTLRIINCKYTNDVIGWDKKKTKIAMIVSMMSKRNKVEWVTQ
jgi:hypothetical protein